MQIEAIGKWNGENLFWEMTDGEIAVCLSDRALRCLYHQLDMPLRYVGSVVRKMHVDAVWPVVINSTRESTPKLDQ